MPDGVGGDLHIYIERASPAGAQSFACLAFDRRHYARHSSIRRESPPRFVFAFSVTMSGTP